MIILYLIIIIIFTLYGFNIYKHYCLVRAVNIANTDSSLAIPILVSGKTIKAFTIEKTFMVLASKTITIGYLTYITSRILNLFGFSSYNTIKLYTQYAKSLCYRDLQLNALNANYIVNVHESVKNINNREINVFLYGNAIARYSDTLPIFNTKTTNPLEIKRISKLPIFKSISIVTLLFIGIITSIHISSILITNHLIESFTLQDEETLWSYLSSKVNDDTIHRVDLLNAQKELQELIDTIPTQIKGTKYNFSIYITNDEDVNITLYPAGHIVISLGLVKKLTSQNQAMFILAHMIKHYNNRDYIKALANKLINFSIINKLSGDFGWIGKLLIWKSDFNNSFSTEEEIKADHWALNVIEDLYSTSLGSYIFESIYGEAHGKNLSILNAHPMTIERTNALNLYINGTNTKLGHEIPLKYEIEDISQKTLELAALPNLDENFATLFIHYKSSMSRQYAAYQEFLKPFNDLLHFHNQLTLAELDFKKSQLQLGIKGIKNYKYTFLGIVDTYNVEFANYISLQQDISEKNSLERMWLQEKNDTLNVMNFYLERDLEILQNQLIITQFLSNRFGSFKINGNNIEFQTAKEKSDYQILKSRIDEILKRVPPKSNIIINE